MLPNGDPSNLCSTGNPLPGGVTFSVNATTGLGLLSGSADAGTGGEYDITIAASSPRGTVTQNYEIIVYQAPAFNPPNAGTLTIGQPGTVTVTASGYLPPTIIPAGLPGGVELCYDAGERNNVDHRPSHARRLPHLPHCQQQSRLGDRTLHPDHRRSPRLHLRPGLHVHGRHGRASRCRPPGSRCQTSP